MPRCNENGKNSGDFYGFTAAMDLLQRRCKFLPRVVQTATFFSVIPDIICSDARAEMQKCISVRGKNLDFAR